jgi:hypothetical protein
MNDDITMLFVKKSQARLQVRHGLSARLLVCGKPAKQLLNVCGLALGW